MKPILKKRKILSYYKNTKET